jgi:hypothetical protein
MKLDIKTKTKLFQKLVRPYLTKSVPVELAKEAFNFCPVNDEVIQLQDFIRTYIKPQFDFLATMTIIDAMVHFVILFGNDGSPTKTYSL